MVKRTWMSVGLGSRLCSVFWLGANLARAQELPPGPPPASESETPVLAPVSPSDADWSELEAYVEDSLVVFDVPGAAVALIVDGQIARVGAYGVRAAGSLEPVDEDTRFMIGSITKSMTTTLAATLVHEGKLGWDDPLVEHLPEFVLTNSEWAPLVRVSDAFGHTSGVPRADFRLFIEAPGPLDLLDVVASVPTLALPGERYEYQNQVFSLGGYAAVAAAGLPLRSRALARGYERLMRRRVFEPLDMARTTADFEVAVADDNHALPNSLDALAGGAAPISIGFERFAVAVAPAGAVWSTVGDMARYFAMHLREGESADGAALFPREELLETHAPRQRVEEGNVFYGLGWIVVENALRTVLTHDGGTTGFNARVLGIPDQDWGLVILTNRSGASSFMEGVSRRVVATLYDVPPGSDDDLIAADAELEAAFAEFLSTLQPVNPESVAFWLGRYERGVVVEHAGDELLMSTVYGQHRFRALPDAAGVFICVDNVLGGAALVFATDEAGRAHLSLGPIASGGETVPTMTVARLADKPPGQHHHHPRRWNAAFDPTRLPALRHVAELRRRVHGRH